MSDEKDALASVTFKALAAIRDLTHVSGDKVQDALTAIAAIIDVLQDGFAGKTTPEVVEAELKALVTDSKFDNGGS